MDTTKSADINQPSSWQSSQAAQRPASFSTPFISGVSGDYQSDTSSRRSNEVGNHSFGVAELEDEGHTLSSEASLLLWLQILV